MPNTATTLLTIAGFLFTIYGNPLTGLMLFVLAFVRALTSMFSASAPDPDELDVFGNDKD